MRAFPFNYGPFLNWLQNSDLKEWYDTLPDLIDERLDGRRWGDMPEWLESLRTLPSVVTQSSDFTNGVIIKTKDDLSSESFGQLQQSLMGLHPWRKGPYELFGRLNSARRAHITAACSRIADPAASARGPSTRSSTRSTRMRRSSPYHLPRSVGSPGGPLRR